MIGVHYPMGTKRMFKTKDGALPDDALAEVMVAKVVHRTKRNNKGNEWWREANGDVWIKRLGKTLKIGNIYTGETYDVKI